jgi:hypothetical protein
MRRGRARVLGDVAHHPISTAHPPSPAPPHHRQRNKKHEEKSEREGEGEDINLPPHVVVNITRLDEDVEEGEVLEEEGFGGSEHETEEKRFDSDDEFGEMKSVGVQDESDKQNLVSSESSDCPSSHNYYYFSLKLLEFWLLCQAELKSFWASVVVDGSLDCLCGQDLC